MADIFISYAREDQEFVRRLHDALEERERDTWIDWKDIPLTANFLQEVYAGIEGSDTFAFMISPDSLDSKVCMQELNHAVENNKRLAPIWHRDVDDEAVPPELASHNWVFFRETDDFEEAFERLVEAMETDLEWVKAHTRLLVRAKEWESEGQDPSYLLHGKDLEAAEKLQVREAEKEPKLTLLQKQYIHASRRAATTLQRRLLDTVKLSKLGGLALILSSALFVSSSLIIVYYQLNPTSFTWTAFTFWSLIAMIAAPLNLLGVLVLYSRWLHIIGIFGLIAFLVTYFGSVLAAGVYWYYTFAAPSIASLDYDVFGSLWNNPPVLFALGQQSAFQLVSLGWLLLGIAILRARLYPRPGVTILIAVSLLNCALNVLLLILYVTQLYSGSIHSAIGTAVINILWNSAIAWLGFSLWGGKDGPQDSGT